MKTKLSIFAEKIIEAGWLAAVVTVPLFFNIYTARTFEPDKITLLRSIVSIMILAWIVSVIEQGTSKSDGSTLPLTNRFRQWLRIPLFLPTLILVVIYVISSILSISPQVSMWGSYQRLQGTYSFISYIVVFALMAGTMRTREQVDRLVTIIIITSIPVSLYGIVQRYGLDPLPWAGNVTSRVASNMGNAIFVASYLIMVMPLTFTRLVRSMTAIIKEETASWGHTVLAAVYIFVLAVQMLTVLFSRSRGPMLGMLGASFVMGLLITLILRRQHANPARLSAIEIASGVGFVGLLGLAGGLGAGIGYFLGLGLQNLFRTLNYQFEGLILLSVALGGLLGLLGLYTYMAATEKGWRWLWISWLGLAVAGVVFALGLNLRGTGLDPYLDPIRELSYLDRLAQVTITDSGTGKVRVLIWDAAMELVGFHEPLGIPGDDVAAPDRLNFIRPLVGYGPESMFNAFAFVYPPDLAHVENRGSSADRSHNETVDSLVITGVIGFLAFYFLMISLFYYIFFWLGWAPNKSSQRRLIVLLILGGIIGAVIPYLVDTGASRLTFVPLGLPFGLVVGAIIHLIWQGLVEQEESKAQLRIATHHLLLIGVLGALIGHFIEVHFVFSIAATYTYFWVYAGLIVALSRVEKLTGETSDQDTTVSPDTEATQTEPTFLDRDSKPQKRRRRRGRRGGGAKRKSVAAANASGAQANLTYPLGLKEESWETWLGSQGLAMAIILIILNFDFITPQFQFQAGDQDSMSLLWMFAITWLVGLAIALSDLAIRFDNGQSRLRNGQGGPNWIHAVLLFAVTSLGYFFFYYLAHQIQFGQRITVSTADDVIRAANVLANGLVVFYIFLLLLMVLIAITLSWGQTRRLAFWRAENWWLYPPLVLAIVAIIWFKNIDVVRADIYLKEGERYRNGGQWSQAIILHDKARAIDSDEDFYYLMLALDYQLMAQDQNLDPAQREFAWQEGERIALEARRINPYNPDNTGNMGRYYFTLGQVFDKAWFSDALDYFEMAITLAPSNVIYHNLWAQTHYILQNYQSAIERLQISASIDPRYPPTWVLLGDTYAAMGEVDQALSAHSEAIKLKVRGSDGFKVFADQFLDQRLNFYISAGRLEDIVAAIKQAALDRPDDGEIQWAIGHAYNLAGRQEQALAFFQQAQALGESSNRVTRELASTYLMLDLLEEALPTYQLLLQARPNDVEAHSALAYIYAQQGRLDEAIQENHLVLQQLPNDYDSLKNLALLYQRKEQWQQALTAAQQAQSVAPEAEQSSWQQFIADIESRLSSAG